MPSASSAPRRACTVALVGAVAFCGIPFAVAEAGEPLAKPPKICLVLSGGGARGAAHVGVIKVLEELRIPVDCIAGTSMGALVGAAYAFETARSNFRMESLPASSSSGSFAVLHGSAMFMIQQPSEGRADRRSRRVQSGG